MLHTDYRISQERQHHMTVTGKIGYACKTVELSARGVVESIAELNTRTTTVAWLNRQPREQAVQRLWDIAMHNVQATASAVEHVSRLPPTQHIMRLSSDMLPMYTEPTWAWFWQQPDVLAWCEKNFATIGTIARLHNIKLSFHPGQFCVLASDNPDIVNRSIAEFEYHANMARWMGYGQTWHSDGFKINVHISGRQGPQGILNVLPRLSTEARNLITIENDEMSWGLDEGLVLGSQVALVLDVHHHWVRTGEYIMPGDSRVQQVVDSWQGVRPTMHYSLSREDLLVDHARDQLPDMQQLLAQGYKKQQLRAHSDGMWNTAANTWALGFISKFDIMCEAKDKNLASDTLHRWWQNHELT